jgi:hypothetical protein
VEFLVETWKNQVLGFSDSVCIQNVIPKYEGSFVITCQDTHNYGYYLEVDDSSLYLDNDSAKFISIIGCCIWIIVLGRFDMGYATSAMSRFNLLSRKEYLKEGREYCLISRHPSYRCFT